METYILPCTHLLNLAHNLLEFKPTDLFYTSVNKVKT